MSDVEKARERVRALLDWTVGYSRRVRPGTDPETWSFAPYGVTGPLPMVDVSDLRLLLAEPVPEVTCPACGATIRARMADQP